MSRRSLWIFVSLTFAVAGALVIRHLSPLLDPHRRRAAFARLRPQGGSPPMTRRRDAGHVQYSTSGAEAMLPPMEPMLAPMLETVPLARAEPATPIQPVPSAVAPAGSSATFGEPPREQPALPPPARRSSGVVLATVAAVAGVLALVLGSWSFYSVARSNESDSNELVEQAVTLLADPSTQRIQFDGSGNGLTIVVGQNGEALLVITGLKAEPKGMKYQAWVIADAGKPVPAVVFSGTARVVPLEQLVPPGATIAITVEPKGGSMEPSHSPTIVAQLS